MVMQARGQNQRRQLIPSKQIQEHQAEIHNLRIRQKGKTADTESLLRNMVQDMGTGLDSQIVTRQAKRNAVHDLARG